MSDLNKEALDVWGALKPMIDQEISSRTQGMVQRRKAKVTTAPSLATNTIGVTEAFGDEMFLPFVSNMISAKVGDFVWIEWMYGATNAFVSSFAAVDDKNLTVAGTLDVVQRRCYATLSSAGWYRVLTYTGASDARALGGNGDIYDFSITRKRDDGNNEVHKITLLNPYNVFKFVDESSASNGHFVTKIRVTSNSTTHTKCVDIYYDSTRVNPVTVDFILHSNPDTQGNCVASGLTAVAASPSGETILAAYDFHANGDYTNTDLTVDGVVDVVPRRCYALLSSAGWYRVMKLTGSNIYEADGAGGFIVDFNIVRNVDTANNEAHKISLMATWSNIKFINEQSVSNTLGITKIRTTNSGSNLYVDIYYGLSTQNTVTVAFNVTCRGGDESKYNSQPFTGVDPSPSGETVMNEYTFAMNGSNIFKTVTLSSQSISSGYFIYQDAAITAHSKLQISQYYKSGETLGLFFILQPRAGDVVVYCRTGSGALPANGSTISAFLTIDNR